MESENSLICLQGTKNIVRVKEIFELWRVHHNIKIRIIRKVLRHIDPSRDLNPYSYYIKPE